MGQVVPLHHWAYSLIGKTITALDLAEYTMCTCIAIISKGDMNLDRLKSADHQLRLQKVEEGNKMYDLTPEMHTMHC